MICLACKTRPRNGLMCAECREEKLTLRRKGGRCAGRRGYGVEFLATVRDALVAGMSRREIARGFGMSTATIWRWTREAV